VWNPLLIAALLNIGAYSNKQQLIQWVMNINLSLACVPSKTPRIKPGVYLIKTPGISIPKRHTGGFVMYIRTTTDPITLNDVGDPQSHPSLFEGNSENGLEIYFESEATKQMYLDMELEDKKVLKGDDSEDYIAEG
jgi:hypothetical protein